MNTKEDFLFEQAAIDSYEEERCQINEIYKKLKNDEEIIGIPYKYYELAAALALETNRSTQDVIIHALVTYFKSLKLDIDLSSL